MTKSQPNLLQQAGMQIVAGGSAGLIEVCMMHPLDLVKTRLQIQNTKLAGSTAAMADNPQWYRGVFDCFRKMYRSEGVRSYYKGILPPILADTPRRALKFFTFEQYKSLFLFGADKPTPLTFAMAGLGAGYTEGILVNPFEIVKVRMQSNKAKSAEAPTTGQMTRAVIGEHGLLGLYRGVTATMARNGVFNMVYFGFYHSVKNIVPAYSESTLEFCRKATIGFVSGTLASIANIPFDVAKSRIQAPQSIGDSAKYTSTMRTIAIVYREEGFTALYKGLVPKVMRLGPGGAVMLIVYDYVYELIERKYFD